MATPNQRLKLSRGRLRERMIHQTDHIRRFLPESSWRELLQNDAVTATLRKQIPPGLVKFVQEKAYRILAILITIDKPELIDIFHTNDYAQEKLPLEPESSAQMRSWDGWNSDIAFDFCDNQWSFIAPRFTSHQFKYEFHESCHLPFTTTGEEADSGPSNYSTVVKASIHSHHVELRPDQDPAMDKSGNPCVAIKTLRNSPQVSADQEADILESMLGMQSKHLIKAIAYYQHQGKHHFMFPWAEHGNLWQFWAEETHCRLLENPAKVGLAKSYLIWIFEQLHGLADAIEKLHYGPGTKSCRHGDLKPENILCFHQGDQKADSPIPAVRMVITDVGLAKDHVERTQLRQATNTKVSTRRYAAPEMEIDSNRALSRRFDLWSMGCILLEFVIWTLYGKDELVACTKMHSSSFYAVKVNESEKRKFAVIEPVVGKWISYIRRDWRCAKGTALEQLLNLITKKLLIINAEDSAYPTRSGEPRADAKEMKQGLEDILRGLKTDTINVAGKRTPEATRNPRGPSHSIPTTQGNMLAADPRHARVRESLSQR